jgi:hypothetical protein
VLRRKDMQEIEELKRQGLSIRAISRLTGYDRKTISNYLVHPGRCAGVWATRETAEQTRTVPILFARTHAGRGMERSRAATRVAGAGLHGRIC